MGGPFSSPRDVSNGILLDALSIVPNSLIDVEPSDSAIVKPCVLTSIENCVNASFALPAASVAIDSGISIATVPSAVAVIVNVHVILHEVVNRLSEVDRHVEAN
jgi:hypothetical protein